MLIKLPFLFLKVESKYICVLIFSSGLSAHRFVLLSWEITGVGQRRDEEGQRGQREWKIEMEEESAAPGGWFNVSVR